MRERNNCVDMARGDAIWKNITHLRGQYHVPMFPIDLVHIALLSAHDKYNYIIIYNIYIYIIFFISYLTITSSDTCVD